MKRGRADGVTIRATVTGQARAGYPVVLDVTIENRSAERVRFFASPGRVKNYRLDVRDADGNPVPLSGYGKILFPPTPATSGSRLTHALEVKEKLHEKLVLTALFDLTTPGKYTAAVKRSLVYGGSEPIVLEAKNLAFEIVDPADEE